MARRRPEFRYPVSRNLRGLYVQIHFVRGDKVLLLHRKQRKLPRHLTRWISVGDCKSVNESASASFFRVARDIVGVEPKKWQYNGVIDCYFETPEHMRTPLIKRDGNPFVRTYVFTVTEWEGEIRTEHPLGTLKWKGKKMLTQPRVWCVDRLFQKLRDSGRRFFYLMLYYDHRGRVITDAALNQHLVPEEDWYTCSQPSCSTSTTPS